ncbi:glucan endo-1,3-beta-glucosidase-like isoform X1 [Nymphaea colorata]|uniref:glucan endo-1,3-beta-glucosidase-like isoform X1 n=2 Tax=Nymphaea colorata TaxID=210225 RepID=UPI00129D65F3|nr:glucan endo-1,3-beta-glucosidase-like isoform X1 [Nymphaea colorata]
MTSSVLVVLFLALLFVVPYDKVAAQSVGVCYGMLGNNLPSRPEAVQLIQSVGFKKVRLYVPDGGALDALRKTGIEVNLGMYKEDLQRMANDASFASSWISSNVQPYLPDVNFKYITVGNEVILHAEAQYVLPAMKNMVNALGSVGLRDQIKVSTSVSMEVIGVSYPPSQGSFSDQAAPIMGPIVQFLASTGAPLMVNVYPYFSYVGNRQNIQLDYALFTANRVVVKDPNNGLEYRNLFDAMVDSVNSAMERAGAAGVPIQVSESGWPSAGGNDPTVTTIGNAQTYNQNLVGHAAQGTPKRPGPMEIFVFALFNENQKTPVGVENNWGLFYPNKQPVYSFSIN